MSRIICFILIMSLALPLLAAPVVSKVKCGDCGALNNEKDTYCNKCMSLLGTIIETEYMAEVDKELDDRKQAIERMPMYRAGEALNTSMMHTYYGVGLSFVSVFIQSPTIALVAALGGLYFAVTAPLKIGEAGDELKTLAERQYMFLDSQEKKK